MRTTLDLPEQLIKDGLKMTNLKTKTALIIAALKEYIQRHAISEIKNYRSKVDLKIDLNALRNR
jgi:hypothetical protein